MGAVPVARDEEDTASLDFVSFEFLDTVGTAGAYEYRIECVGNNSTTFGLNRTKNDNDADNYERGSSALILEEIEDFS